MNYDLRSERRKERRDGREFNSWKPATEIGKSNPGGCKMIVFILFLKSVSRSLQELQSLSWHRDRISTIIRIASIRQTEMPLAKCSTWRRGASGHVSSEKYPLSRRKRANCLRYPYL